MRKNSKPRFVALENTNTARVSMNNPRTGEHETWETLDDAHAIAHAILCFSCNQNLPPSQVEVSITYPPGTEPPPVSDPRRIPPATEVAA